MKKLSFIFVLIAIGLVALPIASADSITANDLNLISIDCNDFSEVNTYNELGRESLCLKATNLKTGAGQQNIVTNVSTIFYSEDVNTTAMWEWKNISHLWNETVCHKYGENNVWYSNTSSWINNTICVNESIVEHDDWYEDWKSLGGWIFNDKSGGATTTKAVKVTIGKNSYKIFRFDVVRPSGLGQTVKFDFDAEMGGLTTTLDPFWNTSWSKKKAITVNTVNNLTDYQIRLNVTYDSDMLSNFTDLRFLADDEVEVYDYWLEDKLDDYWAVVWVEGDWDNTNGTQAYMYYGNAEAPSTSNGTLTFLQFDDFDDGAIDTALWTFINTPATESGGYMNLSAGFGADTQAEIRSNAVLNLSSGLRVRTYMKVENRGTTSAWSSRFGVYDSGFSDNIHWNVKQTNNISTLWGATGISDLTPNVDNYWDYTTWEIRTTPTPNSNVTVWENELQRGSGTGTYDTGTDYRLSQESSSSNGQDNLKMIDWIFAGKYDLYEPSTSFGAEESSNTAPTLDANDTAPDSPTTSDDLTFNITCADADAGDTISAWVDIYKDDAYQSTQLNSSVVNASNTLIYTLNSGNTSKGEVWTGQYTCGDGTVNATANNDSVTITNVAPTINSLTWNTTAGDTTNPLDSSAEIKYLDFVIAHVNDTDGDNTTAYLSVQYPNGTYWLINVSMTNSDPTGYANNTTFLYDFSDAMLDAFDSEGGELTVTDSITNSSEGTFKATQPVSHAWDNNETLTNWAEKDTSTDNVTIYLNYTKPTGAVNGSMGVKWSNFNEPYYWYSVHDTAFNYYDDVVAIALNGTYNATRYCRTVLAFNGTWDNIHNICFGVADPFIVREDKFMWTLRNETYSFEVYAYDGTDNGTTTTTLNLTDSVTPVINNTKSNTCSEPFTRRYIDLDIYEFWFDSANITATDGTSTVSNTISTTGTGLQTYVEPNAIGTWTYTINVSDKEGNIGTTSGTLEVRDTCVGFSTGGGGGGDDGESVIGLLDGATENLNNKTGDTFDAVKEFFSKEIPLTLNQKQFNIPYYAIAIAVIFILVALVILIILLRITK